MTKAETEKALRKDGWSNEAISLWREYLEVLEKIHEPRLIEYCAVEGRTELEKDLKRIAKINGVTLHESDEVIE